MRRQAQGQMVRWVSRSAAMAAGAAALIASGCVRNRPEQPGLLGARSLVPAPFVEPAPATPGPALPAEPAFPSTTVVPSGATLDENLVLQPADEQDVKPGKSSSGKAVRPSKSDEQHLTYTVKKGDSLWLVAQMYGVSVAELTAENSIRESKVLKIGQVLTLPHGARLRDVSAIKHTAPKHAAAAPAGKSSKTAVTAKSSASGAAKSTAPAAAGSTRKGAKEPIPADGMYTIKSGDNPWDLARKFGVKHDELMQWNNLKSDTVLQVGQKIRLRAGAVEGVAPTTPAAATTGAPAAPTPGTVITEPAVPTTPTPAVPTPGTETPTTPAAAGTAAAAGTVTTGAPAAAIPPGALDLPKKLSHSVTEGETLQIIAEMYGTTVDAIKKENPTIKTDADLQPNLKLMVPYR